MNQETQKEHCLRDLAQTLEQAERAARLYLDACSYVKSSDVTFATEIQAKLAEAKVILEYHDNAHKATL